MFIGVYLWYNKIINLIHCFGLNLWGVPWVLPPPWNNSTGALNGTGLRAPLFLPKLGMGVIGY